MVEERFTSLALHGFRKELEILIRRQRVYDVHHEGWVAP